MMHLHVCSFTLIHAGPRWWGLDTSKQFGPRSHTGLKSFDGGQNWDDPAWDHSSLLFTRFVW